MVKSQDVGPRSDETERCDQLRGHGNLGSWVPFLDVGIILVDIFEKDLQVPSLGLDVLSLLLALALGIAGRFLFLQTFEICTKILKVAKQTLTKGQNRERRGVALQKQHVRVELWGLLNQAQTLDVTHHILQTLTKGLALDVNKCRLVLPLPVKGPADVEQELIVLGIDRTLGRILELIVVDIVVPNLIDPFKVKLDGLMPPLLRLVWLLGAVKVKI